MAETDNNIGRVIGDYRLLKLLGKGGMGVVYKARQLSLARSVAVKILPAELSQHENSLKRFFREGKVLAKLEHPNIVQVLQAAQDGDTYYLAMEYVRGRTLREVLKKEGRFEVKRAVDIARQIAEALDTAHEHEVIHRDIKPGNIMLDRSGRVRVLDFGLAKVVSEISSELTATGAFLGSPRYMAPEQWRGEPVTPQTDIYGLGVVLYEMLAGEPPFRGETPQSLMHEILEGHFPAPSFKNPDVTTALDRIVLDMTAKDPAKRYVSAKALAETLQAFSEGRHESEISEAEIVYERLKKNLKLDADFEHDPVKGLDDKFRDWDEGSPPAAGVQAAGQSGSPYQETSELQWSYIVFPLIFLALFFTVIWYSGYWRSPAVPPQPSPTERRPLLTSRGLTYPNLQPGTMYTVSQSIWLFAVPYDFLSNQEQLPPGGVFLVNAVVKGRPDWNRLWYRVIVNSGSDDYMMYVRAVDLNRMDVVAIE